MTLRTRSVGLSVRSSTRHRSPSISTAFPIGSASSGGFALERWSPHEHIRLLVDRQGAQFRMRHARGQRQSTGSSTAGCAASRPKRSCAAWCATSPPAIKSTSRLLHELCIIGRSSSRSPPIRSHHRRHPSITSCSPRCETWQRAEMEMSRSVIEASLGVRPDHICYPVGDPDLAGPREFRIAADSASRPA